MGVVSGVEIINLFPTPVLRVALGAPSAAEAAHLEAAGSEHVRNIGNTTSRRRRLLHDQPMADLRSRIDGALAAYVANVIAPARETRLKVTQAWLNTTTQGQFHHRHAHPGSLVSGVYYLEACESDRIMFFRSGYQRIKFPQGSFNPYNSESWWIPVSAGDLILFPSELEHHVPTLETDTRRVSLAFNTWFDGECGSEDDLTHLSVRLSEPYCESGEDTGSSVR